MQRATGPAAPARSFVDVCTLESLFRHKLLMLAVFGFVLTSTMAYLFLRDRTYESQARLFVRLGRESVTVDPTATATGQVVSASDSQQREIQSVLDLLQSRGVMEHVVDDLGVDALRGDEPADSEETPSALANLIHGAADHVGQWVGQFRATLVPLRLADPSNPRSKSIKMVEKSVHVSAEDKSNVVAVLVNAKTPKLAQRISETVIETFRDQHLRAHRSPGSLDFFQDQVTRVKAELDNAMNQLRDQKTSAGVVSIESQKQVLADRLKEIQVASLQSLTDHEASTARLQNMEAALIGIPERVVSQEVTGLTNTSRDGMRAPLYAVELRKAELSSVLSDEHPLVKKAEEQIRQAKQVYEEESVEPQITTSLNRAHEEIQLAQYLEKANLASTSARMQELQQQREGVEHEIETLNSREVALVDLQRQVDVLDAKYRRYVDNLEQARIDAALEQDRLSSINVIEPPSFNDDPIDFSNSLVALGGMLASVVAAIAAALGTEFLRPELKNKQDIERELGVPVLGEIPDSRRQRVSLT